MEPTAECVKKFWEWCGFKQQEKKSKFLPQVYYSPDGARCYLPPIDLNNLFKYAMPKVVELNLRLELALTTYSDGGDYKIGRGFGTKFTYACSIYSADYQGIISQSVEDKDPALALFWALDKLREEIK